MKPEKTKLTAEFAPETRFELRPRRPAPFRANLENEFERLKDQLLAETTVSGEKPGIVCPAAARGQ